MIEVLFLTDKQVRAKLFERALKAPRPVLVAQVRHDSTMKPILEREPYALLERRLGGVMDQLLVADEGKPEGMWRDPVGDLAEALFPDDRSQAYLASGNYFVLNDGRPLGVVKKQPQAAADVTEVTDVLARAGFSVGRGRAFRPTSTPPPRARPAAEERPAGADAQRRDTPRDSEAARDPRLDMPTPPPMRAVEDPFVLLGIARGTPRREARKIFHALIAQYHPDKVSHLGPEFQVLAEEKTRVLLGAWKVVEPLCP